MEGKLLNFAKSFCWEDKKIDRSTALQNYNDALNEARKVGDQIYSPETLLVSENECIIFHHMWFKGYQSYDQLKGEFEWLKVEDFQILITLQFTLGKPTPNSSNLWEEFDEEFNEENRSLLGLEDFVCADPLVFDRITYKKFHSSYVASFDYEEQKAHFKYFKKYYEPKLKLEFSEISNLISRKQVSNQLIRIDNPTTGPDGNPIHGQQIHVHFKINKKECAINLDGTWKHPPNSPKKDRISSEICSTLTSWGFCLPDEYYQV